MNYIKQWEKEVATCIDFIDKPQSRNQINKLMDSFEDYLSDIMNNPPQTIFSRSPFQYYLAEELLIL
jgi:hypothetical protein